MPPTAVSADDLQLGRGVQISPSARLIARRAVIEDEVYIGDGVAIACDELILRAGTRIGAGSRLVCPTILIDEQTRLGRELTAEVNTALHLARLSDVGDHVRIVAHAFHAGEHLWMTNRVMVGGGGARGPRSTLALGHRAAVMDDCFINVAEPVTIGDDTALSNRVTLLTHSQWQATLDGGTVQYAPVTVGSRSILYVNSVVAPGVTIGDDCTVAAGALVVGDVASGSTAIGNPARVMRSTPAVPRSLAPERQDALIRDTLSAWAETLPLKGVTIEHRLGDTLAVRYQNAVDVVHYEALVAAEPASQEPTITLAFAAARLARHTHFNLRSKVVSGALSPVGEDLRDFLRRRTIRCYTDRPFQSLPPASLARLKAQLDSPR